MNTLFSKRPTYLSKHGLRAIIALALLAATLAFGAFSFAPSAHAASTPLSSKIAASSNFACPPTIQYGSTDASSGGWVSSLQTSLDYDFGYSLAIDGQFGSHTQAAVKDFQSWNGLQVDGIVGAHTWHALGYC